MPRVARAHLSGSGGTACFAWGGTAWQRGGCKLEVERRFTQAADPAAANPCEVYRGELKNYNENFAHKSSAFEIQEELI